MSNNPGGMDEQAKLQVVVDTLGADKAKQLLDDLTRSLQQADTQLQKLKNDMLAWANQSSGAQFKTFEDFQKQLAAKYPNLTAVGQVSPYAAHTMASIQTLQGASASLARTTVANAPTPQIVQHAGSPQAAVPLLQQRARLFAQTGNPQALATGTIGGPSTPPGAGGPGGAGGPSGGSSAPSASHLAQLEAARIARLTQQVSQQYNPLQLARQNVLNAAHLSEQKGGLGAAAAMSGNNINTLRQMVGAMSPDQQTQAHALTGALDQLDQLEQRITDRVQQMYDALKAANGKVTPAQRGALVTHAVGSLTAEDRATAERIKLGSVQQAVLGTYTPYKQAQLTALQAARQGGMPGFGKGTGPTSFEDLQALYAQLAPADRKGNPALVKAMEQVDKEESKVASAVQGLTGRPDYSPNADVGKLTLQAMQELQGAQPGKRVFDFSSDALQKLATTINRGRAAAGLVSGDRGSFMHSAMGLTGMLGELGPEGMLLGAVLAGTLGIADVITKSQASFGREAAAVGSSTPGGSATVGGPASLAYTLNKQGLSFNTSPTEVQGTAAQLALSGIGAGSLVPATGLALGFSQKHGLDSGAVAGLMGNLMGQQGASIHEVADLFQRMEQEAGKAHTSVNQLVDDLQSLTKATGDTRVSVSSLAAVQHILGPGVNAGQFMAPVMSATGFGAMQAAGVLGLSDQQFLDMQKSKNGPAQLFDQVAKFTRGLGGGAQGTMAAEGLLQQLGLVDFSNIAPTKAAEIVQKMQRNPTQAAALAARYQKEAGPTVSPHKYLGELATQTRSLTDAFRRLQTLVQNIVTDVTTGNFPAALQAIQGALKVAGIGTGGGGAGGGRGGGAGSSANAASGGQPDWLSSVIHAVGIMLAIMGGGAGAGAAAAGAAGAGAASGSAGAGSGPSRAGGRPSRPAPPTHSTPHTPHHGAPPSAGMSPSSGLSYPGYSSPAWGLKPGLEYAFPSAGGSINPIPPDVLAEAYQASNAGGTPVGILLAQMSTESGFHQNAPGTNQILRGAPGPNGARGIAQFQPKTLAWVNNQFGEHWNINSQPDQIMALSYYDRYLASEHGGWQQALAAYNGGEGGYKSSGAQQYGKDVYGAFQSLGGQPYVMLSGKLVVVDQSDRKIGTAEIDKTRVPLGYQTHGPTPHKASKP